MNTLRVRKKYQDNTIIEGYFNRRKGFMKNNAIKKVNSTLCSVLAMFIVVSVIGYYLAMTYELSLNKLSNQIGMLNDENSDLQNDLDRLKSFSNVDTKINQLKLLQKADKVIEVSAVASAAPVEKKQLKSTVFNWSIGY